MAKITNADELGLCNIHSIIVNSKKIKMRVTTLADNIEYILEAPIIEPEGHVTFGIDHYYDYSQGFPHSVNINIDNVMLKDELKVTRITPVEMTLKEIEKELGYKVKVIGDK